MVYGYCRVSTKGQAKDEEILQIIKGKYSDLEQVKKAFESGEI